MLVDLPINVAKVLGAKIKDVIISAKDSEFSMLGLGPNCKIVSVSKEKAPEGGIYYNLKFKNSDEHLELDDFDYLVKQIRLIIPEATFFTISGNISKPQIGFLTKTSIKGRKNKK